MEYAPDLKSTQNMHCSYEWKITHYYSLFIDYILESFGLGDNLYFSFSFPVNEYHASFPNFWHLVFLISDELLIIPSAYITYPSPN